MSAEDKWFFDSKTGEVSQGKQTGFLTRMGPYDSEEEARKALEIAQQRNDLADEVAAEERDDDWDDDEWPDDK